MNCRPVKLCWMHSSDSSLALLCTRTSLCSPPFHTTEVRDSVCACVHMCVYAYVEYCERRRVKEKKKQAEVCVGRSCLPSQLLMFVRPVVLKKSDGMSPTSPCCKTGPDISFHPHYKCVTGAHALCNKFGLPPPPCVSMWMYGICV